MVATMTLSAVKDSEQSLVHMYVGSSWSHQQRRMRRIQAAALDSVLSCWAKTLAATQEEPTGSRGTSAQISKHITQTVPTSVTSHPINWQAASKTIVCKLAEWPVQCHFLSQICSQLLNNTAAPGRSNAVVCIATVAKLWQEAALWSLNQPGNTQAVSYLLVKAL